ncbi:class I SAM-dependent methyltransferase [Chamaesiphon sp. OTE_75_metabat_556]|uniref:class I SAM-dependent methyltransferase n=1 Tax=Chamaesiphon sp. OTE_75_metabat_556 TaxID=2964692 RepID=UPI00286CBDB9|nr:class I SAM-dependent methyltransferase [Chamaesiphon sp. OTE_75_metabat_556]
MKLESRDKNIINSDRWKGFWEQQSTPLHHFNNEKWYHFYAQEINLLLDALEYTGGSVLETGCGNGALFEYLNINKNDYIGTDISEAMLDIFRAKYPQVNLVCADAASHIVDRQFSLIYSNGVIQYLKSKQLDSYIQNSLSMLEPGGIMLVGNILWNKSKADFYSKRYLPGELSLQFSQGSKFVYLKNTIKQFVGKDFLGYWYSPSDFLKYQNENVRVYVFGSLFHAYRFSVGIEKLS